MKTTSLCVCTSACMYPGMCMCVCIYRHAGVHIHAELCQAVCCVIYICHFKKFSKPLYGVGAIIILTLKGTKMVTQEVPELPSSHRCTEHTATNRAERNTETS